MYGTINVQQQHFLHVHSRMSVHVLAVASLYTCSAAAAAISSSLADLFCQDQIH